MLATVDSPERKPHGVMRVTPDVCLSSNHMTMTPAATPWPRPPFAAQEQPHFLFIVTPPFSGSTAIAELLHSSAQIGFLQERAEAQWLVPGLCADARWDAGMPVDYASVQASWLARWQQLHAADSGLRVVVEKSPPNMVRLEPLVAQFNDVSLLANNRDPYANCASILYRMHDGGQLSAAQREQQLRVLAMHWLLRSARLIELVSRLDIPLLTYEQFCDAPASILGKLNLPRGVAETIDVQTQVRVKDYPMQGIANQNQRQIALLSETEVTTISTVLAQQQELLDYFSYELR
jgi:hypothetical protein